MLKFCQGILLMYEYTIMYDSLCIENDERQQLGTPFGCLRNYG